VALGLCGELLAEGEERVGELEACALVPHRFCPGFEPNDTAAQPGPVDLRGKPAQDDERLCMRTTTVCGAFRSSRSMM
jgi:hypothetical protein